jgi:hypothetical protein
MSVGFCPETVGGMRVAVGIGGAGDVIDPVGREWLAGDGLGQLSMFAMPPFIRSPVGADEAAGPGRALDRRSRPRAERPAPGRPRSAGTTNGLGRPGSGRALGGESATSIEPIAETGKMVSAGHIGPDDSEG